MSFIYFKDTYPLPTHCRFYTETQMFKDMSEGQGKDKG